MIRREKKKNSVKRTGIVERYHPLLLSLLLLIVHVEKQQQIPLLVVCPLKNRFLHFIKIKIILRSLPTHERYYVSVMKGGNYLTLMASPTQIKGASSLTMDSLRRMFWYRSRSLAIPSPRHTI